MSDPSRDWQVPPLVAILSAAAGSGYETAAENLADAFRHRGAAARCLEVLRFTNPLFRQRSPDPHPAAGTPEGVEAGSAGGEPVDLTWSHPPPDRINTGRLTRLFSLEPPSAIVCTHFVPAEMVAFLRESRALDTPLFMVVVDASPHWLWPVLAMDAYFVPSREAAWFLAERGVHPDSILVTGAPVAPQCATPASTPEVKLRLGIPPGTTTFLLLAEDLPPSTAEECARELLSLDVPLHLILLCGRATPTEQHLRRWAADAPSVTVVGPTQESDTWMAAADFFVGRPGGIRPFEALARGLVLILLGQESDRQERNSSYFLEEGLGLRCAHPSLLAHKIRALLADPNRLARVREAVAREARPRSSLEIADGVLERILPRRGPAGESLRPPGP